MTQSNTVLASLPPAPAIRSARHWIERNLWIKDKAGRLVPFIYNVVQQRLDAILEGLRQAGKLQRLIVLKARQEGVSTWVEGRVYEAVRRNPWLSAFIIGNEQENSEHLYGMFELFYARDRDQVPLSRSNRKELRFQPPHGGQVLVSTAEKAHAGTGHTNQVIHISELAKWPRAQITMLSLLQTLPRTSNSLGIIESTAFGASGYFYDLWWDAKKGLNEWVPVFLAWCDLPEYQMSVGSYPLDDLGEHPRYNVYQGQERLLQIEQHCTLEQLTWRRWAIDNLCGGDCELFQQEYPACLVSGTRVGTVRGILPIEELTEGDVTVNGSVLKHHRQVVANVLRLTTVRGYTIRGTPDHPVFTTDGLVELADLKPGDIVTLCSPMMGDGYHVLQWESLGVRHSVTITEDWGRFLGLFMGDGSFRSEEGCLSIVSAARDPDVADEIERLIRVLFDLPSSRRSLGKKGGCTEVRVFRKGFFELLVQLGVLRQRKSGGWMRKVCVPDIIWSSPKSVIREFLRGLFEADGFAGWGQPRVTVFSRYRQFLQDVQLLLLGFGIPCRRRREKDKVNGEGRAYEGYTLNLKCCEALVFGTEIGFISRRKSLVTAPKPYTTGRKRSPVLMEDEVATVESDGQELVWNLTIEGGHCFDANGILTHNSDFESFLVSGRPRFTQHVLQQWLHACQSPAFSGILDAEGGEIPREGNFVNIWYRPEPGHVYVMGSDCAEGHEGGDYQATAVYDKTAKRLVATIHGTLEADAYAEMIARVGRRYNEALAAVEVNGCGWAVLNRLRHLYGHLYYRAPYDRAVRIPGDRIGWHTMVATKPDMIANLAEVIRDNAIEVRDRETVEELMAYAYVGGGTSAPTGHYDDRVMALGIALTVAGETSLGEYRHYDAARNEGAPVDSSAVQV